MRLEYKLIEIRDNATCIPVLAIAIAGPYVQQRDWDLLARAGYGGDWRGVILMQLEGCAATYDPYNWKDRTMKAAHLELRDIVWRGEALPHLVDVRYALRETEQPCGTEFTPHNPAVDTGGWQPDA